MRFHQVDSAFVRTIAVVDSILRHLSQFTRNMELVSSVRKRGIEWPLQISCVSPLPFPPIRVSTPPVISIFFSVRTAQGGHRGHSYGSHFSALFFFFFSYFLFSSSFLSFSYFFLSIFFSCPLLLCLPVSCIEFPTHSLSIPWPHNCHCLPFPSNPFIFGLESGDSLFSFPSPSLCTTYVRHRCLTSFFM